MDYGPAAEGLPGTIAARASVDTATPRVAAGDARPRPVRASGAPAATGRRGRLGAWAAACAVAVLAVAGCSESSDDPEPPPTAPSFPTVFPSSVPTDPTQPIRAAVLATYRLMWDSYEQAGRAPAANPDAPALERYATGDALALLRELLGSFRDDGLVIGEDSRVLYSPKVVELHTGATQLARVEDCADTSGSFVERTDGQPYEDQPGGLRLIYADVEQRVGEWKVTGLAIGSVGTC